MSQPRVLEDFAAHKLVPARARVRVAAREYERAVREPERSVVTLERERRGIEREDHEVENRHQSTLPEALNVEHGPAREERDAASFGFGDGARHHVLAQARVRVYKEEPTPVSLGRELRTRESLAAPARGQRFRRDPAHATPRVLIDYARRRVRRVVVVDQNLAHDRPLCDRGVETRGDVRLFVARGDENRDSVRFDDARAGSDSGPSEDVPERQREERERGNERG